jgi:hypothetical protein
MSHLNRLRITKGGRLVEETWEKKKQIDVDITDQLFVNLFGVCHIEEGVVLKDILLLVKDYAILLSPLLTASPNWLKDMIDEGLNKPFVDKDGEVKYLELSWQGEVRKYKGEPKQFEQWLSFNGIGDPPKDDPNGHYKDWPAGKPITYAIEMSPIDTISELPVKLNEVIKISDETNSKAPYPRPIIIEAEKIFRLSDILYGIFWELSFLGSPVDRDAFSDRLKEQIEDIKTGKTETIPWDEVKSKIKRPTDE